MKKLWIAFIVLATLGSIYPFNFQPVELDALRISTFLQTCCRMLGRGDILGNVLLFVPVGFTGILARRPNISIISHLIFVCVVATSVALVLQFLQFYLPSRDENLQDVVWNLVGTGCGVALASLIHVSTASSDGRTTNAAIVPLTLVGTWLIYRLIPFVPSLDFQLIKDSIKPVLSLQILPVSIIHDVTAWSIVAYLLKEVQVGRSLDGYFPAVMMAVFCLEVLIIDNQINFSNVVGGFLAVLLWWGVLRHFRWQKGVLVTLLLFSLAVSGLSPFDIRMQAVPFHWIPFQGFLGGSMYLNTQSAAEKVFMYGSLVYLLWQQNTNIVWSIVASFSFVTIIEIAQTILVGHTPELTDPLLLVFAAMALLVLQNQDENTTLFDPLSTSSKIGRYRAASDFGVEPSGNSTVGVTESINLRHYQSQFLKRLSRVMGVSVSAATRRIVAQQLANPNHTASRTSTPVMDDSIEIRPVRNKKELRHGGGHERWVKHSVNFRQEQFHYLRRISKESGTSVSRTTRQIIEQFIDGLNEDFE